MADAHTQTPTHSEKSGSGTGGAGGPAGGRVVSGAAVELEDSAMQQPRNASSGASGASASQRRYHVIQDALSEEGAGHLSLSILSVARLCSSWLVR